MKANFQCINDNKLYVFSCSLLFALLSLLTFFYDKVTIFFFLNTIHFRWMDMAMLQITHCGTGIFSLLVFGIVLLTKKTRVAGNILVTFLITGMLVQVLKPLFAAPRPKAIISPDMYAGFFDGITYAGFTSFPSGHATTVFALATVLAFSCRKKYNGLIYFFIAALVAYSRVYLGQHFMEDVLVGGMMGTVTAILIFIFPISNHAFSFKRQLPTKNLTDQWISNLQ